MLSKEKTQPSQENDVILMTVGCFCGINTQTAISYNMTSRKMPWLRTQTARIPKIKTFTVWCRKKIMHIYFKILLLFFIID